MTWWMRMPKELPRTLKAAEQMARKLAVEEPDSSNGRKARSLLSCGHHDEQGQLVAQMRG